MKTEVRSSGSFALRCLRWLLFRWPAAFGRTAARLWLARTLLQDTAICQTCGAEVSLLGLWECASCGYGFAGFFFAACPVCRLQPPYITCGLCGTSMINPLLIGKFKGKRS